jgi:hypothetical protein
MAKTKRKWIILDPTDTNSVMSSHIYCDTTNTIQNRFDQLSKTRMFNIIRNDVFTNWDGTNTLPLSWSVVTDGTAGANTTSRESTIVRTGAYSLKTSITTAYTSTGIRIQSTVTDDNNNWTDSKYYARAYVYSSVASAMRISIDIYNGTTWTNGVANSAYNTTINAWEDLSISYNSLFSTCKKIRYNIEIKNGVTGTFYIDGASLVETDFPLFTKNPYDTPGIPIGTTEGVLLYWDNTLKAWKQTASTTIYNQTSNLLSLGNGTTSTQDLMNFNLGITNTRLKFSQNIFGYSGFNAFSFENTASGSVTALWTQAVYNSYLGCGTTQTTGEAQAFIYRNTDPTTNTNLHGLVFGYTYNETSPWLGLQYQNNYGKGIRFIAVDSTAVIQRIEINPEYKAVDFVIYKSSSGNAYYYTAATDLHTFSSLPIGPSSAPTQDYQLANKKYVDDRDVANKYTLPAATSSTLGGVIIGSGINNSSGTISVTPYTLPAATSSTLGGVIIGSGINNSSGTISVTPYSLPVATSTVLGGVKQGSNVTIAGDGTISVTSPYTLPVATSSILGGVKQGSNVTIAADGTITANDQLAGNYWTKTDLAATTGTHAKVDWSQIQNIPSFGSNKWLEPVANQIAMNALTGLVSGDMVLVKDDGDGKPAQYCYTGTAWVKIADVDWTPYTLPAATSSVIGGVKPGTALTVAADGTLNLSAATSSIIGGIKPGTNLSVAGDGTLNNTYSYTLPAATSNTLGGVIIGSGINNSSGTISVTPYTLPTASTSVLGGVKVDGTTITASSGVISATQYTLPTASTSTLGGVKVDGTTITASSGTISATQYSLPTASASTLGGIKIGTGLTIDDSGVLSTSGTSSIDYCIIHDEKAQNTAGGTFTSGAWRTRTLNIFEQSASWCTLSSNQFTLSAGRYRIRASAPAYRVAAHMIRLQNITSATTVNTGTSEYSYNSNTAQTRSFLESVITLASSTTFEIQHYCTTTANTYGFGQACNISGVVETFTEVTIEKY